MEAFDLLSPAIVGGRWAERIGRYWYLPLAIMTGAYIGTRTLIAADPACVGSAGSYG